MPRRYAGYERSRLSSDRSVPIEVRYHWSGDSSAMPAASGSTSLRNRALAKAAADRDRSANHESAPASRNISGMPQGKQNAANAMSTRLLRGLDRSQLVHVNGSEEWYRRIP